MHPTLIASGYRLAAEKAYEILNSRAEDISPADTDTLKKIAITSITGKGAEIAKELLTNLAVDSVRMIAEKGVKKIDMDNIKLEKKTGGSTEDTMLINGMLIDKETVHPGMPKRVENAKLALINSALEVEKTQAVSSAAESATMILRIDDVIAASAEEQPPAGGGMPPGGGYPGMAGGY